MRYPNLVYFVHPSVMFAFYALITSIVKHYVTSITMPFSVISPSDSYSNLAQLKSIAHLEYSSISKNISEFGRAKKCKTGENFNNYI